MEITHKSLTRVDVLTLTGRMDASSAPELEQQIDQLFDQGRYRIVLDLSGLEYIASPGLRVLRNGLKSIRTPSDESSGGSSRGRSSPRYWREVLHSPYLTVGIGSARQ